MIAIPGWVEGKVEEMVALYGSLPGEPERAMAQMEKFYNAIGASPETDKIMSKVSTRIQVACFDMPTEEQESVDEGLTSV